MTNIIEIIAALQNEGYRIDVTIIDGHIYVSYRGSVYDITKMSLNNQLCLIVTLLNKNNYFG